MWATITNEELFFTEMITVQVYWKSKVMIIMFPDESLN